MSTSDLENLNMQLVEDDDEQGFDIRILWDILCRYRWWFIASVLFCLAVAMVYLKYTTPQYSVVSKILIKDKEQQRPYSSSISNTFQELGLMNGSNGFDNEIEVLKTVTLSKKTVKSLKLYTRYYSVGKIKNREIYAKYSPLLVDIEDDAVDSLLMGTVNIQLKNEGDDVIADVKYLKFEKAIKINSFPAKIDLPFGKIRIEENPEYAQRMARLRSDAMLSGQKSSASVENKLPMEINILPLQSTAHNYAGRLSVEPTSKTTTVAFLAMTDNIPERGKDYMTKLIEIYNAEANDDQNEEAKKTAEFIQERLDKIRGELNMTESELEEFKRSANIVDYSNDTKVDVSQKLQYESQIIQASNQRSLIDYLSEYVNEKSNFLQIIPTNVGITDASLAQMIAKYNECILERNRMLRTVRNDNPILEPVTAEAQGYLASIKASLGSLKHQVEEQMGKLVGQQQMYQGKIANAPGNERTLANIGRQQEVQAGLYLMLLQKNEENSITLASAAYKAKVIEEPITSGTPISPKRKIIIIGALFLGILIPYLWYFITKFFRTKVQNTEDLRETTSLPIIGKIPFIKAISKGKRTVVVQQNRNSLVVEVYRSLRSNLPFILKPDQNVLMFTSSVSGEGKTSIAANLGASLAFAGKKVLIMGLDIRKPRLAKLFGFRDTENGISIYLAGNSGDVDKLDNMIYQTDIIDNLYILPAGPIPPNPAELLEKENLKVAIDYLKQKYDFILLDTAPIGLVSDTVNITRLADATLFVVRCGVTEKVDVELFSEMCRDKNMQNVNIILNGVKAESHGYSRYSRGKYGNTYGYSYGYGLRKQGKIEEV